MTTELGTPFLTWYDEPESNSRWWTHYHCRDGGRARYFVPLDDCPPPEPGDTQECAECAGIYPVIADPLNGDGTLSVPAAFQFILETHPNYRGR